MGERKKLLVVDDDPALLKLLSIRLARHYEVVSIGDPAQVVTRVRNELPDVILCDIHMPIISGGQLSRRLAEDPVTARIPFIYLTGLAGSEDLAELNGFIAGRPAFPKTGALSELIRFIEQVCGDGLANDAALLRHRMAMRSLALMNEDGPLAASPPTPRR